MLDGARPALGAVDVQSYLPVLILIAIAASFAIANVVISLLVGPRRDGPAKGRSYESGMNPIGSPRKRFNVRFYLIAMVFLVFDIEIIFLYPWATTFPNIDQTSVASTVWLARILFFVFTTLVAYAYGLRKGVFRFD